MAMDKEHHGKRVYIVSLAYESWCLRNRANLTELTLDADAKLNAAGGKPFLYHSCLLKQLPQKGYCRMYQHAAKTDLQANLC